MLLLGWGGGRWPQRVVQGVKLLLSSEPHGPACGPRSEEGTGLNAAGEPGGGVFLELWRLPVLSGDGEEQSGDWY